MPRVIITMMTQNCGVWLMISSIFYATKENLNMDQQRSDLYEPGSRFNHVATSVSDDSTSQVIVWGGETPEFYSNDGRIRLVSVVEQFDVHTEVWCQHHTLGSPHPALSIAACTSLGNYIFAYGGHCDDGYSNMSGVLSCLNVKTLTWSQLCPAGTAGGPMGKVACGIVQFSHDKLAVIGGYGFPTGPTQPGSSFIRDIGVTDGSGWTNEIHVFDLIQGVWFFPTVRGTRPPPCSNFTLTSIDNHRAVLFGGGQPGRGKVSDLYLIDFNTMEITKVEPREGEPWPVGRVYHAACCLGYAGDHIHLLVTGGNDKGGMILKDSWLFNLSLKKWKEVTLPDGILPRWGHSITAIILCPGLVEVIVFGGTTEDLVDGKPRSSYSRIAETAIVTFGLIGSEWEVMGVASNNKRTASERVREKMLLKSGTDTQGLQISSTLDSEVTPYALYRLEREGVQVRREISSKNKDFQAVLRQKQPDANSAMIKWTSSVHQTSLKPTWKSLLLVLHLINLDHLAEQINTYLSRGIVKQLPEGASPSKEQEKSLSEVFTFAALTQLEKREGIPVLTELEAKNHEFQAVIRVKQSDASWAINKWLTTPVLSRIKPTWKNLLCVLRLINLDHLADNIEAYSKKHSLSNLKEDRGGDIEKLRDDSLALCDKLMDGDIDTNAHHLRYKIEILSKSAIEQIKEKTETNEMLLADLKKLQESSNPPQLGPVHGAVEVKTEPPSPGTEQFDTSTQETDTTTVTTTQFFVKQEPPEGDIMSTPGRIDSTEFDALREENQQLRGEVRELRDQLALVKLPEGIMETQPISTVPAEFRGVEVCGETTVVVTNDPRNFVWEGYGLKLHIPQGCLPADTEQCTINIKASLAGQYEFPEKTHLVSAVFWLCCVPKCMFMKRISLEINHCAKSENVSKLSFVKALCTQEELPYTFQRVSGKFSRYSSYGTIELESFSGLSVAQDGSDEREYCALLFYLHHGIFSHTIHFVIVWNSEAHLTAVKGDYEKKDASSGADQLVEFESSGISLNIPVKGITLDEGWKIMPHITPVVMKKHVDNYRPGRRIPKCQLSVVFVPAKDDNIPLLQHQVKLEGAKEPFNMIAIELPTISEFNHGGDRKRPRELYSGDFLKPELGGPSPKKKHLESQRMERITLEDVAFQADIGLDALSKECSEAVLLDVAKLCVDWQLIGKHLKLTEAEITAVDGNYRTVEEKRIAMLQKWKDKLAFRATYQALIEALLAAGKASCAVDIAKIIGTADNGPLSTGNKEHIKKRDEKPTLKYLMKELHPKVSDKWDDVGIELEIDDRLLIQIRKDYPGDSKQCLKEVLREWLQINNPPPSWEAIAQVMADIGEDELATHL